jgi:hypothetical protein
MPIFLFFHYLQMQDLEIIKEKQKMKILVPFSVGGLFTAIITNLLANQID